MRGGRMPLPARPQGGASSSSSPASSSSKRALVGLKRSGRAGRRTCQSSCMRFTGLVALASASAYASVVETNNSASQGNGGVRGSSGAGSHVRSVANKKTTTAQAATDTHLDTSWFWGDKNDNVIDDDRSLNSNSNSGFFGSDTDWNMNFITIAADRRILSSPVNEDNLPLPDDYDDYGFSAQHDGDDNLFGSQHNEHENDADADDSEQSIANDTVSQYFSQYFEERGSFDFESSGFDIDSSDFENVIEQQLVGSSAVQDVVLRPSVSSYPTTFANTKPPDGSKNSYDSSNNSSFNLKLNGQDFDGRPMTNSRFAVVTIFYEVGVNDAEYFLGARVALSSWRNHGSSADLVVLVPMGCPQHYIDVFERDGFLVRTIQNIGHSFEQKVRWGFVLNKLSVWKLTEYEKVVFVDADVVATANPDELFGCGDFCVVWMNQVHFHTGLMVIKPDQNQFQRLLDGLKIFGSFDGADQGYLNSFYQDEAKSARRYKPKAPVDGQPIQRLSVMACFNDMYWYALRNWDAYVHDPDMEILTVTFPTFVNQNSKPWCWYGRPLLELHDVFSAQRWQLESFWGDWWAYAVLFFVGPLILLIFQGVFQCIQACVLKPKQGFVVIPCFVLRMAISVSQFFVWRLVSSCLPCLVPWQLAFCNMAMYFGVLSFMSIQIMCIFCRWPVLPLSSSYVRRYWVPILPAVVVSFFLPGWFFINGFLKLMALIVSLYTMANGWMRLNASFASRMLGLLDGEENDGLGLSPARSFSDLTIARDATKFKATYSRLKSNEGYAQVATQVPGAVELEVVPASRPE